MADQCHMPHNNVYHTRTKLWHFAKKKKKIVQSLRRLHEKKLRPDKNCYIFNLVWCNHYGSFIVRLTFGEAQKGDTKKICWCSLVYILLYLLYCCIWYCFITCQNLEEICKYVRLTVCYLPKFLWNFASMFVWRFVTCQNFQFWQICSSDGLSVCLFVGLCYDTGRNVRAIKTKLGTYMYLGSG